MLVTNRVGTGMTPGYQLVSDNQGSDGAQGQQVRGKGRLPRASRPPMFRSGMMPWTKLVTSRTTNWRTIMRRKKIWSMTTADRQKEGVGLTMLIRRMSGWTLRRRKISGWMLRRRRTCGKTPRRRPST